MGRRLVWKLGMIKQKLRTQNQTAQRPEGKDSSSEDVNSHLVSFPRSPPSSLFVGDLWCYISLPLVHPLPTLVSHLCPYLSARPIGYSFWRSVSCCGLDRTVQGSRPHKWGQGVSCGYLIRMWQLLLELLFYHAPMAGPLGLELPLGYSRGLPLATWRFPLSWFWSVEDRVVLGSISGSLDSLCSSSNISSSSAWALGLIWSGPKSPDPLAPQLWI